MPIYPPRNTAIKKKQILDYKIFEFLKHSDPNELQNKIEKKAEAVRIAKLNLIKARLFLNKSYKDEGENKAFTLLQEKLNNDLEKWKSFSFKEIKGFCVQQKKTQ